MTDPADLATIGEVIAAARAASAPEHYTWAANGVGQGVTVKRNTEALSRLALIPRVMRDVEDVDPSTSFVGVTMDFPVFLAPVGALALFDEGDALAAGAAAAATGAGQMVSALTLNRWEDVAALAPGRRMFQLYVFGDRPWTGEVLRRVEEAGFASMTVTVDTPVIGRRDASLEQRFTWSYPEGGPPNFADVGWDASYRTRYTAADLEWLCGEANIPIIAKGIMTAEDARIAVDAGAKGIYVSNHGGRQVDREVSTIEMLPEIVEEVGGEVDIAIDSGFTRGAEVVAALALGADAVAIGRLQCWGLAAGGAAGLTRTLEILRAEVTATLQNIGCRSLGDLTPDQVRWSFPITP
jgi:isopentenyl diphosphate isomerase/L-lactate dehydrogenase-like FMN-dependent dehydrogenase